MKTNELIQNLTADLQPTMSADSVKRFFPKWFAFAVGAMAIWFSILPFREDLSTQIGKFSFHLDNAFWLALTALSTWIVYRRRLPSLQTETLARWVYVIAGAFALLLVAQVRYDAIDHELEREMSLFQGRCGPIILAMALSWAAGLVYWVRKGAPTKLASTGGWIAFSAGCLASFAMQAVCSHGEALHLIVWHMIPVSLLAFVGAKIGERSLRW